MDHELRTGACCEGTTLLPAYPHWCQLAHSN